MNVIVGKTSIVMEHDDKVYRFAVDRYFDDNLINTLVNTVRSGDICEYDHTKDTVQQGRFIEVNGEPVIITKLPV